MGRVLCASFLEIVPERCRPRPKPYTFDASEYAGRNSLDDSLLCTAIRDELPRSNLPAPWNGKLFDIPFLNARLAKARLSPSRPQFHLDAMYYARGSGLRIGSSKLDNVQKYFGLSESKTELEWATWQLAGQGDLTALAEVVK